MLRQQEESKKQNKTNKHNRTIKSYCNLFSKSIFSARWGKTTNKSENMKNRNRLIKAKNKQTNKTEQEAKQ